jgi:hypothetical protein
MQGCFFSTQSGARKLTIWRIDDFKVLKKRTKISKNSKVKKCKIWDVKIVIFAKIEKLSKNCLARSASPYKVSSEARGSRHPFFVLQ